MTSHIARKLRGRSSSLYWFTVAEAEAIRALSARRGITMRDAIVCAVREALATVEAKESNNAPPGEKEGVEE